MRFFCFLFWTVLTTFSGFVSHAQEVSVYSPDKLLQVKIFLLDNKPYYSVVFNGKTMLENSPLGLKTNEGDFTDGIKYLGKEESIVDKKYQQDKIKQRQVNYTASKLTCTFENAQQKKFSITFQLSNHNVAFRYELPTWGGRQSCVVESEATGYKFPAGTTTFLSGMMSPMTGFARTAPSYESGYEADGALGKTTRNNEGFVFPGLFRIGNDGWVLLSETGVSSLYCASHLGNGKADGLYTVEYPNPKQNNGFGSTGAALGLPGVTPWRTLTVGNTLKPIVETTISYDVVDPLYEASQPYKYGKGTWSWIVWQDASMNYDDQVKYIDLAAALGFEYILMDALWDTNI